MTPRETDAVVAAYAERLKADRETQTQLADFICCQIWNTSQRTKTFKKPGDFLGKAKPDKPAKRPDEDPSKAKFLSIATRRKTA